MGLLPQLDLTLHRVCKLAGQTVCLVFLAGCTRIPPPESPAPFSGSSWRVSAALCRGPIVLDPGHGGRDSGANSGCRKGHLLEKKLNLATALALQTTLAKRRLPTMLSRKTDYFVSLDERARKANVCHAVLMVSIHHNWASNVSANGIEIFYPSETFGKERSRLSRALAQAILARLGQQGLVICRGVKPAAFKVLRATTMPAVLIEAGFLSNLGEVKQLGTAAYRAKVATGVADGIEVFLNSHTRESASVAMTKAPFCTPRSKVDPYKGAQRKS